MGGPRWPTSTAAAALHELVRDLVARRVVAAVHDCSDGGLAVALAEMAMAGGVGVRIDRLPAGMAAATALFSESASRVVVAVPAERTDVVVAAATTAGVPVLDLGVSGGDRFVVAGACDEALADLTAVWRGAIPALMGV